jgi:hypothetical protein
MKVEKLAPDILDFAVLFTLAVVMPLLAVLVVLFAYLDLRKGRL